MIRLTRFNHQTVVVNATAIVSVEATPDTLLTLLNGDRVHVRETVDEVIERSVTYHQRIQAGALHVVTDSADDDGHDGAGPAA